MAIATLDENEVGPYAEDGGPSNNAKVNANFAIVRKQTVEVPIVFVASTTVDYRRRIPQGATVTRVGVITDGHPAGGTATLDILQGANSIIAAPVNCAALVDDTETVPALHGTPANLQLAAGYLIFRAAGGAGVTAGVATVATVEFSLN